MPWRGKVSAYLVLPFAQAEDGLWVQESETICFDHDLALSIAEADGLFVAWVGVYPLDKDGLRLTRCPIACYGEGEPPAQAQPGWCAALSPSAGCPATAGDALSSGIGLEARLEAALDAALDFGRTRDRSHPSAQLH